MKSYRILLFLLSSTLFSCQYLDIPELNPAAAAVVQPCGNPFAAPDSIVQLAQSAYGQCELPSLTLVFAYAHQPPEAGWNFYLDDVPCTTNDQGFLFLEDIAPGTYQLDNRQGGWFDYVCGPQVETVEVVAGTACFVHVQLWCE